MRMMTGALPTNTADDRGTRVDAGFKLLAQNVSLGFEVFDSIGLETTGAYATIDADGNEATNPELADASNHSDFVSVAVVLDQAPGSGG